MCECFRQQSPSVVLSAVELCAVAGAAQPGSSHCLWKSQAIPSGTHSSITECASCMPISSTACARLQSYIGTHWHTLYATGLSCCAVPISIPVVATADAYSTTSDTAVVISPISNDLATDNSTLQLVGWVTHPAIGNLTSIGSGSFWYTPTGEAGTDRFTYNVSDGTTSAVGVVDVTVGKLQMLGVPCLSFS